MEILILICTLCNLILLVLIYKRKSLVTQSEPSNQSWPDSEFKKLKTSYEQEKESILRDLLLQKILDPRIASKESVIFLRDLTQDKTSQAIEKNDYTILQSALEAFEHYLYRAAPRLDLETVIFAQSLFRDLRSNVTLQIEENVLSHHETVPIDQLIAASRFFVNTESQVKIFDIIKERRRKLQQDEIHEMIMDIKQIDTSDSNSIYVLNDWANRASLLAQKDTIDPKLLIEIRTVIDSRIKEISSNGTSFKIPSEEELSRLNNLLSGFETPMIISSAKYGDINQHLPRIIEIVQKSSLVLNHYHTDSSIKDVFDLNRWTNNLNNLEKSKLAAYSKYALEIIDNTHKKFGDASFFGREAQTKYNTAKELLYNSIWTLDEELLTPSIIKVMREVEDEILSKLNTNSRIEIEGEKIAREKTSIEGILKS